MKHWILLLALVAFSATMQAKITVTVKKAGQLESMLSPIQQDTCRSLTVIGPLNSADIQLLRRMGTQSLRVLNLLDAKFQNDKTPFLVLDMKEEGFRGTSVPEFNCSYNLGNQLDYYIETKADGGLGGSRKRFLVNEHIAYYRALYTIASPGSEQDSVPFAEVAIKRLYVDFTKNSTWAERRKLRSFNMLRLKSHRVKWEDGRYVWYAFLSKGRFSADMFYGCNQLRAIVLPRGIKMLDDVKIYQGKQPVYYVSAD